MLDYNIKTLRDTLKFKYDIYVNYKELLNHIDIPYEFDRVNKPFWRWYFYSSGAYYSRIHSNYSIWYNNHFKKKIGVFMPIVWKTPHKREKIWGPWYRKYYIYDNSYINNINKENNFNYFNFTYRENKNLNYYFYNYNYYKSTVITNYSNLSIHRKIRSYKAFSYFGYENNMFFSGYNYRWHNLYFRDTFYHQFLINPNFVIPVNFFLMCGSFFIDSYDSDIIIHPYLFLENNDYTNLNRALFFMKNINNIFHKNINNKFIMNIIILIKNIYKNNTINMLKNYRNKFLYNKLNLYKFNLLYKNFYNKNFLLWFNRISLYNMNKFTFFNENIYFHKLNNNIKNIEKNNIIINYFLKIITNRYYNYNMYYNLKSFITSKYFNNLYWNRDVNSINYWIKNLKILDEKYLSRHLSNIVRKLYYNRIKNIKIIINNLKKLYITNKKVIYNFFKLKKINKKVNFKIKRYTTYEKIFTVVPNNYKFLYDKCTIMLDDKNNWHSNMWSKYMKKYNKKIKIFIYKYFNFFISLLKFNFGFYYNLNIYIDENIKNMDMNYYIYIQLIIYKFFSWFKSWKKFIYRIPFKKKYLKILYKNIFNNIIKYKKNIYKSIIKNKVYFNILKYNKKKINKIYKYING